MANPASAFELKKVAAPSEYTKFSFRNLYMYRIGAGEGLNQTTILDQGYGFGHIVVNNWTIYDGLVTDGAKRVARGQGLHINAGDWCPSFTIVFEDERYSDSTLEVMGVHMNQGRWAIVGGTGQFALASGVMTTTHIVEEPGRNVDRITLEGLCPSHVFMMGLWGGIGGITHNIEEEPHRLVSVTIRSGDLIDALGYTYIDRSGQRLSVGPWGGLGEHSTTIQFAPAEYVKEISGTTNGSVVSSIKFVTNVQAYGPFRTEREPLFSITIPSSATLVGFVARAKDTIDAVGIYVRTSVPM